MARQKEGDTPEKEEEAGGGKGRSTTVRNVSQGEEEELPRRGAGRRGSGHQGGWGGRPAGQRAGLQAGGQKAPLVTSNCVQFAGAASDGVRRGWPPCRTSNFVV